MLFIVRSSLCILVLMVDECCVSIQMTLWCVGVLVCNNQQLDQFNELDRGVKLFSNINLLNFGTYKMFSYVYTSRLNKKSVLFACIRLFKRAGHSVHHI